MPSTALQHFTEDIARARAIVTYADPLPHATPSDKLLRSDLLRAPWMFAVGALDAYFCDAYTDIVAATRQARRADSRQSRFRSGYTRSSFLFAPSWKSTITRIGGGVWPRGR